MSEQSIIEQLERICASQEFSSKPVIKKLLTYLITAYLEGRSDQLKGYTIAVDVFEVKNGFDPDQNPLVRINAGRLRRLLRTYYLDEGANDTTYIEIPKGGYSPVITERAIEVSRENTPSSIMPTQTETDDRAIVVVPFNNNSGNSDLTYLAYGFAQELSDDLAKFEDMRVYGSSKHRDDSIPYTQMVEQYKSRGVRFFVEGDIVAFGNQTKLSVRLMDTTDGIVVWNDKFGLDLTVDKLFEVVERVAQTIANKIGSAYGWVNQLRYDTLKKSRPNSIEEQDVLLKFYAHAALLTRESTMDFHESAFKALEKDPDSALLNAIVGGIYTTIYGLDFPGADEALQKAGPLIEKAYAINPDHSVIRATLAGKCFYFNEHERLLGLVRRDKDWMHNSSLGLGTYATWSCLAGEWTLGKELLDRVFSSSLDVAPWLHGVVSLYHYKHGQYIKALEAANKYRVPGMIWEHIHRLTALSQLGRMTEAEEEFEALTAIRPDFRERGHHLIHVQIKDLPLAAHLIEGFDKIGIPLR